MGFGSSAPGAGGGNIGAFLPPPTTSARATTKTTTPNGHFDGLGRRAFRREKRAARWSRAQHWFEQPSSGRGYLMCFCRSPCRRSFASTTLHAMKSVPSWSRTTLNREAHNHRWTTRFLHLRDGLMPEGTAVPADLVAA